MSESYLSKRERWQRMLESLPTGLREHVSLRSAEAVASLTPQAQARLAEAIRSGLKRLPRTVEQLRINPNTSLADLLNPPPAACLAIATAAIALLLLAGLHILSPEFDPSWRMVSEYANGHYGWVLSLMFAFWALSSWALAFAIRSQVRTRPGKIGLVFLIASGVGEAMATVFDINNQPLHDIAGYIGIRSLPVAAMLISVHLSHIQPWSAARKALLWTANLTWMSVGLLVATFIVMIVTYMQSGAKIDPQAKVIVLPPGVIGLAGWANRLLVVVYCVWVMTVAWQAIQLQRGKS